jgi:hypothetical protein
MATHNVDRYCESESESESERERGVLFNYAVNC